MLSVCFASACGLPRSGPSITAVVRPIRSVTAAAAVSAVSGS